MANALREVNEDEGHKLKGMLITAINGVSVAEHPLARFLLEAGFQAAPMGFNVRRKPVGTLVP